ncbi:Mitochondrial presequence protease, partial [Nowakowskiella sp. JEL0078]
LSCLPTLTVSDISKIGKSFPVTHLSLSKSATTTPLQYRATQTNGISYINISRTLCNLKSDYQIYLPLFTTALGALDTSKHSLPELDELTRLLTGGVGTSIDIPSSPHSLSPFADKTANSPLVFSASTNAISSPIHDPSRLSKVYDLIKEITAHTKFESVERMRTVVLGTASSGMNSVAAAGHRYAEAAAAARDGFARQDSVAREMLGGLQQIQFVNRIAEGGDEVIIHILNVLKNINEYVCSMPYESEVAKAAIVSSADVQEIHASEISQLFESLKWNANRKEISSVKKINNGTAVSPKNVFYPMPFAVNYSARVFHGVPYMHPDSPILQILARLMTTNNLHRELREKGGAYGGAARYSANSGLFSMFTYRDPASRILKTLEAYENVIEWAAKISDHLGNRELDEAKLALFSGIDAPVNASSEGMTYFRTGVTDEMFQNYRQRILNATLEDVKRVCNKYLVGAPSSIA